jgi:hypothetical protein
MDECSDSGRPDITSTGELRDALHRVFRAAESNDVPTRGTWSVPTPDDDARWLVDVTRPDRRETITPDAFPATAIVRAVAEYEGVPTSHLPPLYETVDTDVVESIYDAAAGSTQRVTFEYVGYTITVRGDGTIAVGD